MNPITAITDINNSSEEFSINVFLQENQFISPSFQIYGSEPGLQDYGFNGVKIKNNLLSVWRKEFLFDSDIHEIETPILTPYDVLKTSGHVDRFADYVVYDVDNKCHRADHIIKNHMKLAGKNADKVDDWTGQQMEEYINEHVLIETKDNEDAKVITKNLMFQADDKLYLRPEIAQSMFTGFKEYYDYLGEVPFGIAQIGKSFRKEISPKKFLRLRSFTQAEIEYFFNPFKPTHAMFPSIKDMKLPLLTSEMQKEGKAAALCDLYTAVKSKMICNEVMAYFLAKIYMFATKIGLDMTKVRFRQHMPNEMAHYAADCYDLECLIQGNWVECIGCANRQDYDLRAHSKATKEVLKVKSDEIKEVVKMRIFKKKIELAFPDAIGLIMKELAKEMKTPDSRVAYEEKIYQAYNKDGFFGVVVDGKTYKLSGDMIQFKIEKSCRKYFPHVIEPSFGIDRLLFALLEHNYKLRETAKKDRCVPILTLNPVIAPYDISIIKISNKPEMVGVMLDIKKNLASRNYKVHWYENVRVSIGKQYNRADRLGIVYAITVDFDTMKDNKVTVRNRDTKMQIKIDRNFLYRGNLIEFLQEEFEKYGQIIPKEDTKELTHVEEPTPVKDDAVVTETVKVV